MFTRWRVFRLISFTKARPTLQAQLKERFDDEIRGQELVKLLEKNGLKTCKLAVFLFDTKFPKHKPDERKIKKY